MPVINNPLYCAVLIPKELSLYYKDIKLRNKYIRSTVEGYKFIVYKGVRYYGNYDYGKRVWVAQTAGYDHYTGELLEYQHRNYTHHTTSFLWRNGKAEVYLMSACLLYYNGAGGETLIRLGEDGKLEFTDLIMATNEDKKDILAYLTGKLVMELNLKTQ